MSLDGVCDVCGADERTYTDPETGTEFCIRCQFRRWERTAAPVVLARARRQQSKPPKPAPKPKPKPPKPAPKPKPPKPKPPKPRPKRKRKPGDPRTRERYVAAGLCVRCGAERDRPDRIGCKRCRRRQADAQNRHRAAHPPDRDRLYADMRERRQRYRAAGLCGDCGGERDRPYRRLCARCRRRAVVKQQAHRNRTNR